MDKYPEIVRGKQVPKGWGKEIHIANNEDYCGKLLVFDEIPIKITGSPA